MNEDKMTTLSIPNSPAVRGAVAGALRNVLPSLQGEDRTHIEGQIRNLGGDESGSGQQAKAGAGSGR